MIIPLVKKATVGSLFVFLLGLNDTWTRDVCKEGLNKTTDTTLTGNEFSERAVRLIYNMYYTQIVNQTQSIWISVKPQETLS